jgi:hypothetical protein
MLGLSLSLTVECSFFFPLSTSLNEKRSHDFLFRELCGDKPHLGGVKLVLRTTECAVFIVGSIGLQLHLT